MRSQLELSHHNHAVFPVGGLNSATLLKHTTKEVIAIKFPIQLSWFGPSVASFQNIFVTQHENKDLRKIKDGFYQLYAVI